MDNSVFDILSKMLMGGFNTNAQNFSQQNSQNNQNTQSAQNNNASSYYPDEMFVAGENQNNTQNNVNAQSFASNTGEQFSNQASGNPFNQNNLMPMLLSLLSGNKNASIADMMSALTGQSKSQSEDKSKDNGTQEKIPPSDEIIL